MAARTWAEIPSSNTLSSLDPDTLGIVPPGSNFIGTRGLTLGGYAWTGAVWDEANKEFRLPMMGGHTDYGGNETYRIALGVNSPVFVADRRPSGAVGMTPVDALGATRYTGRYDDGRRRPGHLYNNACFVPGLGPVVTRTAGAFPDGVNTVDGLGLTIAAHVRQAYWLDNAGESHDLCDFGAIPGQGGGGASQDDGGAAFDPTRGAAGTVWTVGHATSRLIKIDIATGTATPWGASDNFIASGGALKYIPGLDVLACIGPGSNFQIIRLDLGATAPVSPALSGAFSAGLLWDNFYGAAVDWETGAWRFLIWCNPTSRTELSTLTMSNPANPSAPWVRGVQAVAPGNAVTPPVIVAPGPNTHGASPFGRGAYSPSLGAWVMLGNTTQKPYAFALD